MDVVFETRIGKRFTIEIGYFDTVLEIKEKIHKYTKIPVPSQTLIFNGQVMSDDLNTEFYEVLHGSRIHLLLDFDSSSPALRSPRTPKVNKSDEGGPHKCNLTINIPSSNRQLSLEVNPRADTVARLRDRIGEAEGLPISRLSLFSVGNVELHEQHKHLAEYGISEGSEVSVALRQGHVWSPTSSGGTETSPRTMTVMVQPQIGKNKIAVEVNPGDNVGQLRKELRKLHSQMNFHLPPEGYFFIYKQNVMDEDRSFRWHEVRAGDTIDIWNGSVSGGS